MLEDKQLLEDLIPDPNEDLLNFGNNKLLMKILSSVAASQAQNTQTTKAIVLQMDKIEGTLDKLVESDHERKLYQQSVDSRFFTVEGRLTERKEENKKVESIAIKALDRVDTLERQMNATCDITTTGIHETTDDKIKDLKQTAKYIIGLVGALVAYIFISLSNDVAVTNHQLHTHLEQKGGK